MCYVGHEIDNKIIKINYEVGKHDSICAANGL